MCVCVLRVCFEFKMKTIGALNGLLCVHVNRRSSNAYTINVMYLYGVAQTIELTNMDKQFKYREKKV